MGMESFVLQLHITGRCNCSCKHCYLDAEPSEMALSQIEGILLQYKDLIAALENQFGKKLRPFVNITGGEPFIHKDIYGVLDLMDRYSSTFSFRMMSNGLLLDDALLHRLQSLRIPCLQLSLDGDAALHDQVRGPGNFQAVCDSLHRLHQYGIATKVSFTAHSGNYQAFPRVAEACRACGVSSLWSDRYVPCGTASGLQPLTKAQTKEYVALLQAEKNNPANRTAGLQILNRRSLQFLASGEYPYSCSAGIRALAVDDKGDVYPCRRLAIRCGNVFSESLSHIYQNAPLLKQLRSAPVPEKCGSCPHAAFCRGGAKCLSYALRADVTGKDPGCWLFDQEGV